MSRLLRSAKNWLRSNRLLRLASLARDYYSDYRRFIRHSSSFRTDTKEKLKAKIIRQCHIIEKGLALREPVKTLSRFRVRPLIDDIDTFISRYSFGPPIDDALSALCDFGQFLKQEGIESVDGVNGERLLAWVAALEKRHKLDNSYRSLSTTRVLTRERVHDEAKRDLRSFFSSRHSVRQFDDRRVDDTLIEQAVEMAIYTPSACNRQPWRVYIVREPKIKRGVLALQGGNLGFGDQADVVLIVTGNVSAALHPGERMQPWLDGGMFAMSLVYGLHSLGLGTCCLNWSKNRATDRELRKLIEIPDNEVVLMMIAVGHLPDKFEVASSRRYPISDVMVKI